MTMKGGCDAPFTCRPRSWCQACPGLDPGGGAEGDEVESIEFPHTPSLSAPSGVITRLDRVIQETLLMANDALSGEFSPASHDQACPGLILSSGLTRGTQDLG